MKLRLIGAAAALLLALIGTVLILSYVQGADQRALAGVQTRNILVVTNRVPAGTTVASLAPYVAVKPIPSSAIADGALASLAGLSSQVAAVDLVPGEQLLRSRLVDASSQHAAGTVALPKGMQEITVTLPPEQAAGGQLMAGDTVGIFVTFKSPEPATHLTFQKVLLTKVQGAPAPVTSTAGSTPGSAGSSAPATAPPTSIPTGSLMLTMAVTAPDAEKIVFAAQFGSIWLSNEPATATDTGISVVKQSSLY